MLKKSVGTRLLVIMLAIAIVGMGLVVTISGILAANTIYEQSLGRISESTKQYADSIGLWVVEQTNSVHAIATTMSALPYIGGDVVYPVLKKLEAENFGEAIVYVGFPNGRGIFSDDWEPDYDEWNATQRDWYKGAVANPGTIYMTDFYQDAMTGQLCVTFSKVFMRDGVVGGVLAVDIYADILEEVIKQIDVGENSYAFLTASNGDVLVHSKEMYIPEVDADGDTIFSNIGMVENQHYASLLDKETIDSLAVRLTSVDGIARYYSANVIPVTGWILFTAIPASVINAPVVKQVVWTIIALVAVLIVMFILIFYAIRRLIIHPVKDVTNAANLLARGEKVPPLKGYYIGEIALLADSFRGMEEFNRQQAEWMESVANGDLAIDVKPRSEEDSIGQAMVSMLCNLNALFSDINISAHQVAEGSKQIAGGAQSLSHGTSQQAAAVEELSATLNKIIETTERNAEIADEAASLSDTIKRNAEKGSLQMDRLMEAVKEINDASNSIRNVIKTIDDIAFQTNILALNAAVEAARAGQHGKGFAVVADEVRVLAAKSAEAAKNTEGLIINSIEKANLGLEMATETAASLTSIVEDIIKSTEIAGQVAESSGNQAEAIEQINKGIGQVSQVVQQNAATAEESAAASEEMSNQSESLETLISYFKLRDLY